MKRSRSLSPKSLSSSQDPLEGVLRSKGLMPLKVSAKAGGSNPAVLRVVRINSWPQDSSGSGPSGNRQACSQPNASHTMTQSNAGISQTHQFSSLGSLSEQPSGAASLPDQVSVAQVRQAAPSAPGLHFQTVRADSRPSVSSDPAAFQMYSGALQNGIFIPSSQTASVGQSVLGAARVPSAYPVTPAPTAYQACSGIVHNGIFVPASQSVPIAQRAPASIQVQAPLQHFQYAGQNIIRGVSSGPDVALSGTQSLPLSTLAGQQFANLPMNTVPIFSPDTSAFQLPAYASVSAARAPGLPANASLTPDPAFMGVAQDPAAQQGMFTAEDLRILQGAPHALTRAPIHPIDRFISAENVKLIQSGKFFDLDRLLAADISDSKTIIEVQGDNTYQIKLDRSSAKKPKISSIEEWNHSWSIYMSVLLRSASISSHVRIKLALDMLAYREHINTMAKEGADWYYYDSCFRRLMPGSPLSFNEIEVMLWLKACKTQSSAVGSEEGTSGASSRGDTAKRTYAKPPVSEEVLRNRALARSRLSNYELDSRSGHCYVFLADLPCPSDCEFKHWCPSPGCGAGAKHSLLRCPNARFRSQLITASNAPAVPQSSFAAPPQVRFAPSDPARLALPAPPAGLPPPPPLPTLYPPPRF